MEIESLKIKFQDNTFLESLEAFGIIQKIQGIKDNQKNPVDNTTAVFWKHFVTLGW